MLTPTRTNLPPLADTVGYRDGKLYLVLDNGKVEFFPDVFSRLSRMVQLENDYNAAIDELAERYNL